MSSAKLDALKEALAPKTRALLVIRNDKVVYEWYGEGQSATTKQSTASLAKAIVGGLVLRKGDWQGQRLLSEAALSAVTRDAGLPGPCGMG